MLHVTALLFMHRLTKGTLIKSVDPDQTPQNVASDLVTLEFSAGFPKICQNTGLHSRVFI